MLIKKVLNNSLVLADDNGEEIILMGKGIGYRGTKGDSIDAAEAEKVFGVKNSLAQYEQYAKDIPDVYFDLALGIIQRAENELGGSMSDNLILLLADHISYAVERQAKGLALQNRLLWEIKSFYPREFEVGEWAIEHIGGRLNIELPEDEAGNIAFHLVNARSDAAEMKNTMLTVSMMKDILGIIRMQFPSAMKPSGIHYSRMITHIQFFLQRILDGNMLKNDDVFMLTQYAHRYPDETACVEKIAAYVLGKCRLAISLDEKFYLLLHIVRNVNQSLDD